MDCFALIAEDAVLVTGQLPCGVFLCLGFIIDAESADRIKSIFLNVKFFGQSFFHLFPYQLRITAGVCLKDGQDCVVGTLAGILTECDIPGEKYFEGPAGGIASIIACAAQIGIKGSLYSCSEGNGTVRKQQEDGEQHQSGGLLIA